MAPIREKDAFQEEVVLFVFSRTHLGVYPLLEVTEVSDFRPCVRQNAELVVVMIGLRTL